jgi:hypothetical protein
LTGDIQNFHQQFFDGFCEEAVPAGIQSLNPIYIHYALDFSMAPTKSISSLCAPKGNSPIKTHRGRLLLLISLVYHSAESFLDYLNLHLLRISDLHENFESTRPISWFLREHNDATLSKREQCVPGCCQEVALDRALRNVPPRLCPPEVNSVLPDAPGRPVRVTADSRGPVSQLPSQNILQSPGVVARLDFVFVLVKKSNPLATGK